jgi:hypothetical protein
LPGRISLKNNQLISIGDKIMKIVNTILATALMATFATPALAATLDVSLHGQNQVTTMVDAGYDLDGATRVGLSAGIREYQDSRGSMAKPEATAIEAGGHWHATRELLPGKLSVAGGLTLLRGSLKADSESTLADTRAWWAIMGRLNFVVPVTENFGALIGTGYSSRLPDGGKFNAPMQRDSVFATIGATLRI